MTKKFTVSDVLITLMTVNTVTVTIRGDIGVRFKLEDGYHSVTDQEQIFFDTAVVTSITVADNGEVQIQAIARR